MSRLPRTTDVSPFQVSAFFPRSGAGESMVAYRILSHIPLLILAMVLAEERCCYQHIRPFPELNVRDAC